MDAFAILVTENMLFGIEKALQDFDMRINFLDSTPMRYELSRVVNHPIQIAEKHRQRATSVIVLMWEFTQDIRYIIHTS